VYILHEEKINPPINTPLIILFHTIDIMALRRPPTRIELKADDVEEYDKVRLG
jgi:hypothetical protein